jgi:hypothetical protein
MSFLHVGDIFELRTIFDKEYLYYLILEEKKHGYLTLDLIDGETKWIDKGFIREYELSLDVVA